MKFRCQHVDDKAETHCLEYTWRDEKYCRWHLIPREWLDYESSGRKLMGFFYIFWAIMVFNTLIKTLWLFLNTTYFDHFIRFFFWGLVFNFFLSLAMMMRGSHRVIWPKLFSVSVAMVSIIFVSSSLIGILKPEVAEFAISLFWGTTNISSPLFYIITSAGIGIYFSFMFMSRVLFFDVPRYSEYLLFAAYFIIYLFLAFFSDVPLKPLFWIFVILAIIAQAQFNLIGEMRKRLDL